MQDIQFRGAISDFQPLKAKIIESPLEAFLIRINEANLYGDNNNFELALTAEAIARWEYMEQESARQARLRKLEARCALPKCRCVLLKRRRNDI